METESKLNVVGKLLDLQVLVGSMLLPAISHGSVAAAVSAEEVWQSCIINWIENAGFPRCLFKVIFFKANLSWAKVLFKDPVIVTDEASMKFPMENAEITVQPQAKSAAYIVKAVKVDLVVGSKETPEVAPDITDEKETKPPKREAVVKETEPVDEKAIDGNGNDASSLEAGNRLRPIERGTLVFRNFTSHFIRVQIFQIDFALILNL